MRKKLRFVDLFAGLGGFHLALRRLEHRCVFASEINPELQSLYTKNFGLAPAGDLRAVATADVPAHDVLCAGFPCQPFSKAGEQKGTRCALWGDLFSSHVLRILRARKPSYFIFENVANLERHDGGQTWARMKRQLTASGYNIQATVMSPHRFGIPQIRERLFIVGNRHGLDGFAWPSPVDTEPTIRDILERRPRNAKPLSTQVVNCLSVWDEFLQLAPPNEQLPSFPIWSMEFGATYPFTKYSSLHRIPLSTLRNHRGSFGASLNKRFRSDILANVPSHARSKSGTFPHWKQQFIRQNRAFYRRNREWIAPWLHKVRQFPSSLQKFEWNCKGEERDIWKYVIQFRASGVRAKRPTTAPSLVAMTTTQVPIIAWEKRYMTPRECCILQSMHELEVLPSSDTNTYKALGNAVNVRLVEMIAESLLRHTSISKRHKAA